MSDEGPTSTVVLAISISMCTCPRPAPPPIKSYQQISWWKQPTIVTTTCVREGHFDCKVSFSRVLLLLLSFGHLGEVISPPRDQQLLQCSYTSQCRQTETQSSLFQIPVETQVDHIPVKIITQTVSQKSIATGSPLFL